MSKPNYSELFARYDADAAAAKASNQIIGTYLRRKIEVQRRMGAAILSKKSGVPVYRLDGVTDLIEKRYRWFAYSNFEITKVTQHTVSIRSINSYKERLDEFEIFIEDLDLSTWDFAVEVRKSISRVKQMKDAEAKLTQAKDLAKLQAQVRKAQANLNAAIKAAENHEKSFARPTKTRENTISSK